MLNLLGRSSSLYDSYTGAAARIGNSFAGNAVTIGRSTTRTLFFLLMTVCLMLAFSCKKQSFITGTEALISVSEDSIHFDTLFTSTGSITRSFKLYNRNSKKLLISSVKLAGGNESFFKINADGFTGPEINNMEMDANDSLYVFVTVKIDPSAAALPFVVEDSIKIAFNGNERLVQLRAWGQNANFLESKVISANTTWTNEKPYVVLGGLLVAEQTTLTIEKGTRIYLHADAPLLIDGTLKAIGEKYDSTRIIFQGDRLDEYYRDYPGAWPGIYFREKSRDNVLTQVIIKNAYQGIVVENPSLNSNPKVILQECIIDNCYDAGIIGINSHINAVNCLISNNGKNIVLLQGGKYNFTHCTDVAITNSFIAHKHPVLTVANFIKQGDVVVVADLYASFMNCIFWGENSALEEEVVVSMEGNTVFETEFVNCLWKLTAEPVNIISSGNIANEDPLFETINTQNRLYDFHLREGSPAIDSGANTGIATDLDGNARDENNPDIGAYETTF